MGDDDETHAVELLYKYRPLEPFEYVADIIRRQRFYASHFRELNDPMEGLFDFEEGIEEECLKQIQEGKEQLRVCSFSKTWNHPVLWAHYAGNFRGICIEVEVERYAASDLTWVDVRYARRTLRFCNSARRLVSVVPQMILTRKARHWVIEREVRALAKGALAKDKFIPIEFERGIQMSRIFLGVRMPEPMAMTIRKITPPSVSVWTTQIGRGYSIELGHEIPPERR